MRSVIRTALVCLILTAATGIVQSSEPATAIIVDIAGDWYITQGDIRVFNGKRLRAGENLKLKGLEGFLVLYFVDDTAEKVECRADIACRPYDVPSRTGIGARLSYLWNALSQYLNPERRLNTTLSRGTGGGAIAVQLINQSKLRTSLSSALAGSPTQVTLHRPAPDKGEPVSLNLRSEQGPGNQIPVGIYNVFISNVRSATPDARILVVAAPDFARASTAFDECTASIARVANEIRPAAVEEMRAACLNKIYDELNQ